MLSCCPLSCGISVRCALWFGHALRSSAQSPGTFNTPDFYRIGIEGFAISGKATGVAVAKDPIAQKINVS